MSTGRAMPTSGPARAQRQRKPEMSPVAGLHFTDGRIEAQRVIANLHGTSEQIREKKKRKEKKIPSLRHCLSTYLKIALAF